MFWITWPCLSIISETLDLVEMVCTLSTKSSEQHGLLVVQCKATGGLLPRNCKVDLPLSALTVTMCSSGHLKAEVNIVDLDIHFLEV